MQEETVRFGHKKIVESTRVVNGIEVVAYNGLIPGQDVMTDSGIGRFYDSCNDEFSFSIRLLSDESVVDFWADKVVGLPIISLDYMDRMDKLLEDNAQLMQMLKEAEDVLRSSNVLELVEELAELRAEILRLKITQ